MGKIKTIIVEDEFAIAEDIGSRLVQNGFDVLSIFDKAENAYPFISKNSPDILLVDIRLRGEMDGIALVRKVQQKIQIPVVYITANSDTATYERARKTNPQAFLIKPFTAANLLAAVDLALFNFALGKSAEEIDRPALQDPRELPFLVNQNLFIRANGKFKKLAIDDLLFVEASGSYVHIHSVTDRFTLSHNLTNFQKKTPLSNLVRIHRSYLVNINKVDSFEESFVFIQNHKLPLSDSYRNEFLSRIHLL
jgi:DNA-binding LytR/AlgR family response regulator